MKRAHLLAAIGAILFFVVSCQKTPTAEVSISQNELTASAMGGNISVNVSSNVDLTVRISVPWITQTGAPSGGGGLYSFNVERNSSYDPRTATITFSNGEQGVSETVNVIQSQQDAIIPGKLEYELFYEAQTFTLPISANVDYTVSLDGGDWIKSLGTRGLSSKQYQFSIAENTGKTPREAVLNISSDRMKQSIKIVQLPTTHFPQTRDEWKESVKLNKEISDARLEIFQKLEKEGITDVNRKAESLKGIQGAVDVIVNFDGSVISIMQRDSVWLDILMFNPVSVLESGSPRQSSFQTIQSGHSVPTRSGVSNEKGSSSMSSKPTYVKNGGKALILSAFQWQFGYPVNDWYNILGKHFQVDSLLNSNVDIRYFTGEIPAHLQSKVDPIDEYDFILFATHGGFQYIEGGFFTTGENVNSFLTGTVVSEETSDLAADMKKKKLTVRTGSVDGSPNVYYEILPDWFDEASFNKSAVVLAACHSAETKTMVNKLRDKGASFVSGNLASMSCRAIHVYIDNLLTCMDNGLSFVEAHDYASKSSVAQQWVVYTQGQQKNEKDSKGNIVPITEKNLNSWDIYTKTVCFPEKSDDGYYFISPFPELSAPQKGEYSLKWTCNLSPFKTSWLYFYDFYVNELGVRKISGANKHDYSYSIVYDVYIDKKLHSSTKERLLSVAELPKGKYKAYVIANIVVGEGNNVLYSYKSNEVSFETTGEVVKVTGVRVSPSTVTIEEGLTYHLSAEIFPSNASNKEVTWKSNHPEYVTVDETGLITAVKRNGPTTVYVTATTVDGGKTANCRIIVKEKSGGEVAVTGISLNQSSAELEVGKTLQLKSTITPSNATNKSVQWTSSNSAVASVDINGLVTAKAIGTAQITAKTEDGGKTATVSITVKKASEQNIPVTGVSINMSSLSLKVGESATLTTTIAPANATNKGVTWSTSMSSVATVTSDGVVTAKAAGTAVITAKTDDGGKTATCNVTVTYTPDPGGEVSVTQVTISPTSVNMSVGDTKQFSVKIDPANATNQEVSWSSSDPSVASIDSKGLVTAKAEGKATITVTANDGGVSSKATVTVNNKTVPVTGVSVSPASLSMEIGESKALSVTVSPSDATDKTYTVTSDNTGVVDIDNGNNIVAKGAGTANVLITTSDGGFTAKCVVTVNKPQMTISVEPSSLAFGDVNVGESSSKTFSFSNTGKAEVKVSGISVPEAYSVDVTTPFTIAVGQSKTVTVTFAPTDGKDYNGSITITSDADSQPTVTVSGKGIKSSTPSGSPEAVDLGLPSGLLWASCNLGASKPEEDGNYYAWGETKAYGEEDKTNANNYQYNSSKGNPSYVRSLYVVNAYKWYNVENKTYTKYASDDDLSLESSDDAAHVILGGKWRIPTKEEWQELIDNCKWTWVYTAGNGLKIESKTNGNSIYLPFSGRIYVFNGETQPIYHSLGFYWSSTGSKEEISMTDHIQYGYYSCPYCVGVNQSEFVVRLSYRFEGSTIRPVRSK